MLPWEDQGCMEGGGSILFGGNPIITKIQLKRDVCSQNFARPPQALSKKPPYKRQQQTDLAHSSVVMMSANKILQNVKEAKQIRKLFSSELKWRWIHLTRVFMISNSQEFIRDVAAD